MRHSISAVIAIVAFSFVALAQTPPSAPHDPHDLSGTWTRDQPHPHDEQRDASNDGLGQSAIRCG